MSEIPLPPSSGGGNSKYALVGAVLLLLSSAGIWSIYRTPDPRVAPPPRVRSRDASVPVGPVISQAIELPPELPDAGPPPDTGPAPDVPPRIRYVTRYVGCSGTIDIARVNSTAQSNYGGLRDCYEHELRGNPGLRGPLSARLMINTTGHVDDVGVNTAMNSRALVACVKRMLQRITFPPARNGCAVAEVRFNFSPRE